MNLNIGNIIGLVFDEMKIFVSWNTDILSTYIDSICLQHPITRFLARYILSSPQQEYEKFLHQLYEEDEKAKIR
jgi:hypothetical protein